MSLQSFMYYFCPIELPAINDINDTPLDTRHRTLTGPDLQFSDYDMLNKLNEKNRELTEKIIAYDRSANTYQAEAISHVKKDQNDMAKCYITAKLKLMNIIYKFKFIAKRIDEEIEHIQSTENCEEGRLSEKALFEIFKELDKKMEVVIELDKKMEIVKDLESQIQHNHSLIIGNCKTNLKDESEVITGQVEVEFRRIQDELEKKKTVELVTFYKINDAGSEDYCDNQKEIDGHEEEGKGCEDDDDLEEQCQKEFVQL